MSIFIKKWKNILHFFSCEIDQKWFFYKSSALQAVCVWYFDHACCGVCILSWRTQVGDNPQLVTGLTGRRRSALFCARKLCNPHWGGQKQTCVEFSVHKTNAFSMSWLLEWATWVYRVCRQVPVSPLYMWQASGRSSPDLMLGLLGLSSHDATCGGRRSLLFRGDLSCAPDVMQRLTHTPVLIEWRPTSEIWRSALSGVGRCTLDPNALRAPISHTAREYAN